jgi:hypothetical protein
MCVVCNCPSAEQHGWHEGWREALVPEVLHLTLLPAPKCVPSGPGVFCQRFTPLNHIWGQFLEESFLPPLTHLGLGSSGKTSTKPRSVPSHTCLIPKSRTCFQSTMLSTCHGWPYSLLIFSSSSLLFPLVPLWQHKPLTYLPKLCLCPHEMPTCFQQCDFSSDRNQSQNRRLILPSISGQKCLLPLS